MICSNCGKDCGEDKYCANCGTPTSVSEKENVIFPKPPIRVCRGANGRIELRSDSLTIYKKAFLKTFCKTILYRELYAISFAPAKAMWGGHLCLREWQDRKKPLLDDIGMGVGGDDTTVIFQKNKNSEFESVYRYLVDCVELTKNTLPEAYPEQGQLLLGKYDAPNGFMELYHDRVTFYKKKSFRREVTRTVLYDQLAEVAMQEAKWYRFGALTVREKTKGKNMPDALRNAMEDDTSFSFEKQYNDVVKKIYAFMLEQIRKNQTVE